jgi:hypothetical protein
MKSVDTVIADVHGKELDLLVDRLSGNPDLLLDRLSGNPDLLLDRLSGNLGLLADSSKVI